MSVPGVNVIPRRSRGIPAARLPEVARLRLWRTNAELLAPWGQRRQDARKECRAFHKRPRLARQALLTRNTHRINTGTRRCRPARLRQPRGLAFEFRAA